MLLPRDRVRQMKRGAAIVDVSIDQGGFAETSRPTTHREPVYVEERVVHYCVTNMPALVPHTSTYALTNATLSYGPGAGRQGSPTGDAGEPAVGPGPQRPRRQGDPCRRRQRPEDAPEPGDEVLCA